MNRYIYKLNLIIKLRGEKMDFMVNIIQKKLKEN